MEGKKRELLPKTNSAAKHIKKAVNFAATNALKSSQAPKSIK
jgi:hypothetical protein